MAASSAAQSRRLITARRGFDSRAADQFGGTVLHHYITKYVDENDERIVESWLQLNLFGLCWCFSKRRVSLGRAA